jgi:hypothetical protein
MGIKTKCNKLCKKVNVMMGMSKPKKRRKTSGKRKARKSYKKSW